MATPEVWMRRSVHWLCLKSDAGRECAVAVFEE